MCCGKCACTNAIAFGAGLLTASIFPCRFVIVVAAVTIIIVALILCRR